MATWIALAADAALLERWRTVGLTDGHAISVTPALAAAQDYAPDSEEAERAAVIYASVQALTKGPSRLVVVAEVSKVDVVYDDDPFGRAQIGPTRWADVRSIFADDPERAQAAAAVHEVIRGLDLDEAWDSDALHAFLASTELLWFDPSEAQSLEGR